MTSRAERASLVAEAERTIRVGSKSFRFASNIFDQKTRERAWLLYAWCRACDDLADGQTLGHGASATADPARRIALLREKTDLALAGKKVGLAPFDALRVVAAECAIPRRFIDDHLEGFALDARGWRPRSEEDLLLYCYHVAGAVGCMMAIVMGVDAGDEDMLDRACDLGIAFQLANISRDIVEDHGVGRLYLPQSWIGPGGFDPSDRQALAALAGRLAALVAGYEASARTAVARLPFRSRWAVLSAANIYGGIARKVAARAGSAWDSRTVIGKPAKFLLVFRALIESAARPAPKSRDGLWTRRR
ncbi:MAG TPA: phytoene/squalene synthase family protein [Allosphingosinicella sp.]|nr:phytoene/squalene synthase family protein [Allosphingosinicella sp.]